MCVCVCVCVCVCSLDLVVLYCSSRFGVVEPYQTHASLWSDTSSCGAVLLKQVQ